MHLNKKIKAFSSLRQKILEISDKNDNILKQTFERNSWFIPAFCMTALRGIAYMLEEEKLERWLSNYLINPDKIKKIGIVMAGNIPAVGFHDLLSVILSGHHAKVKLSHKDDVLIPYLMNALTDIDPELIKQIQFTDSLSGIDAVIATGSDNTARYVDYHFRNIPGIIRKNRTSCCIIQGNETIQDLEAISNDIFTYFGLGCRNVSKIYVPKEYEFNQLVSAFKGYSWVRDHPKYNNNYRYQVSKHTLEKQPFIDGEFYILEKNPMLVSPISCIFYEEYEDVEGLDSMIEVHASKIQCIISGKAYSTHWVKPGTAQFPNPWDYADNVDTMAFLQNL